MNDMIESLHDEDGEDDDDKEKQNLINFIEGELAEMTAVDGLLDFLM